MSVIAECHSYLPVENMMENDYHNPYDHRAAKAAMQQQQHNHSSLDRGDHDSDQLNHYEAPSCLVRNPSGSLFIPAGGKEYVLCCQQSKPVSGLES